MGLVGQPRLARTLSAAIDGTQDAFGARDLAAHGANRHTALTHTKKGTQVAIVGRVKNDTLTKFVVGDPFSGLKLSLYFHAPTSGNSQMEEARRFRALAQQDFLRVLVGFAPQQTA